MQQSQQSVPDSSVRPIFPSYLSNWLDNLGAYDLWPEEDWDPLELMRLIYESDAYFPYMVPFPTNIVGSGSGTGSGNVLNFNAGETQTGAIQISPGSYLVSAGCYVSEGQGEEAPNAFPGAKIRIYDKATQSDLFYATYGYGASVFSDGSGGGALTPNVPFGPHLFESPLVISSPGILQWEITNLDPNNAATIQVLLSFAVPKGSVSGNVVTQEAA